MEKHGRDRLIRERHEVLAEALPHSLGVALAAAMKAVAAGKSEDEVVAEASDAIADAFEYWYINGEWPPSNG